MSRTRGVRSNTTTSHDDDPISPNISMALVVGGVAGYSMFSTDIYKKASLGAALLGMALYVKAYFIPGTTPSTNPTLM